MITDVDRAFFRAAAVEMKRIIEHHAMLLLRDFLTAVFLPKVDLALRARLWCSTALAQSHDSGRASIYLPPT